VTAASGETLTIFLPEYIFSNQEQFCDALRIGDCTHSLEVHYVHVINEFGQQTILSKLMMIVRLLRDIRPAILKTTTYSQKCFLFLLIMCIVKYSNYHIIMLVQMFCNSECLTVNIEILLSIL
jgi:hypothetical protein